MHTMLTTVVQLVADLWYEDSLIAERPVSTPHSLSAPKQEHFSAGTPTPSTPFSLSCTTVNPAMKVSPSRKYYVSPRVPFPTEMSMDWMPNIQ